MSVANWGWIPAFGRHQRRRAGGGELASSRRLRGAEREGPGPTTHDEHPEDTRRTTSARGPTPRPQQMQAPGPIPHRGRTGTQPGQRTAPHHRKRGAEGGTRRWGGGPGAGGENQPPTTTASAPPSRAGGRPVRACEHIPAAYRSRGGQGGSGRGSKHPEAGGRGRPAHNEGEATSTRAKTEITSPDKKRPRTHPRQTQPGRTITRQPPSERGRRGGTEWSSGGCRDQQTQPGQHSEPRSDGGLRLIGVSWLQIGVAWGLIW